MDELQKLYNVLSRDGYYTKSFDEFVAQWEDGAYRDKVYQVVSRDGLYTKDKESFLAKYSSATQPAQQQPVQQPLVPMSPLKKKEGSTSPSESGVLERYGFNAKRALGQEEQKPIMTQPLPERLQPAQKKDSKTWERETALPEVITDYTKPIEEVSLLRPKEKPAEEPLGLIGRYVPERDEKKTPKFIEETLSALTPDKFNLTGTEPSKKALEYYLKDMGFKIEDSDKSSSYAGKYVNVISPSGEKHLFYLGNEIIRKETFGYAGLPSEDDIEQLKDFVRASAFSDSSIAKKEYLYEKENKKFKTKESIDNEVKDISAQEQKFQDDYKSMLALQKDIEDIEKDLKRWEDFGEQNTPKYIQTKAYLDDKIKEYNDYIGTLKNKEAALSTQAQQLEKSMGKYFEFQSTQGSFEGTLYRSIAESSANIFSNYVRAATSRTIDALPMSALMDEDLYKEERLRKLKEKGYEDGTAPQSVIEEVDAEIRDRFKKAAITGKVGEEKLQNVLTVQGVRESLKDFVTSVPVMGTSEYKERREKEGGFVERGVIGLAGSLPAMVGNRYLRLANMFMMTTDAVMQEMDNDPSFANVSENEKELIAAPIGVIGAALEEIGLRNLIKGTSITSSIVKSVLGRVPSNATASTIRKATFDAVKEMGLRGTVALAGATLAEAETGAAQQISEYAVKDIYNAMKGEKRFDNPAFLSGQYFYDIYDAARTEAVGGFVMGVPYSAAAAFKKDGFRGLDDETFKIFEQLAKDNDSKKFFVTDLKNKINRGEITPQQGKQILDAYNEASGMIGVVPDEITDTESRKIAMDLLSERKKLEAKKQGKDDALAKPIQDKINQINEQLSKLTEDAIQKQAAGEVSLQPETEPSKEMEAGGTEAGSQAAPKQGVLSPEEKEKLTQNRRVDLFPEESEFADVIGGSGRNSSLSDYNEVNGVGIASYTNPDNGLVDVIMSGTSDNDYVGYVRVYENGKPTNRWTSKMSNESGNKENFKTMISEVQARLPENHEYTEKTNISIDGVRVYSNQLNRGYEVLTDANGNPVTNTVTLNAASVEGLQQAATQEEKQSLYDNMTVTTREQFNALRDKITALMPNTRVLWNQANNTVQIQLPVLVQSKKAATTEQGGMEQAEGLGTQLEMVAKEEQIPTEVTPATEKKPLNFAVSGVSQGYNVWQSGQKVEAIENKDPRELLRNSETTEITPEGSKTKIIGRIAEVREGGKVAYYAIAQDAKFDEDQEFTRLKDFVGRSGPIAVMLSFNESDNVSMDDVRTALVEKLTNVVDKSVDKMTFKTSKPADLGTFEFSVTPKAVEVTPVTEVTPATEVTPTAEVTTTAEQFTEQDRARKAELEEAMRKADKRRKNITVGETTMTKAEAKAELDALVQKEQAVQQPAAVEVAPTEVTAEEVVERTPEQEADLLDELLTGKKKEPVVAEVKAEPTSKEAKGKKSKFIDEKGRVNVEEILKTLSDKFSIPFEIINDPDQNYSGKFEDGRVYVNLAYVTAETPWHEFAHPFIEQVKADNPNLYNSLKEEILNTDYGKKILSEVESLYPELNKEDQIEEAIVETIARFVTGKIPDAEISNPKNKTLLGKIIDFINGIRTAIAKAIGVKDNKNINIASLNNSFKLKDFAQMMQYGHRIDLQEYAPITGKKPILVNSKLKYENVKQLKNQYTVGDLNGVIHNIGAFMNNTADVLTVKDAVKNLINLLSNGNVVELASFSGLSDKFSPGGPLGIKFKSKTPVIRSCLTDINSYLIKDKKGRFKRVAGNSNKEIYIRTDLSKNIKDYDEVFIGATVNNIEEIIINTNIDNELKETIKELSDLTGAPIVQNNQTIYEPSTKREYKPESVKYSKFTPSSLADAVRKNLKIKGPGGLQSNLFGIPIAIWNAAVKTTAAAIDANVAVAKAVQQGVKEIKDWIKKNNPSLSLNDAKIKNTILVETYAGVIKTARANNIKNEGLTTYFKRKGLSDAQIAVLFKAEQKEATELSEKTIPGYTKLMNRINGIIARGRKDGKSDDVIMKGVIANVESRSPEYANATDQQREQIIRDIRKLFGKKEKAAPSAAKILGKPKPKKVAIKDEYKAMITQIKLETKAAREAKGDLNTKRKMLAAAIKEMQKKGKITVRQATALINKVNSVNLDNPIMVERMLDYAEKVFNNADYAEKLSQANKLQSQIKQLSKNKEKFGNLTAFAAEFAKIDPALVENIDEYIEMASKVKEGVQGSKVVGGKVIPADMVDVGATMEYVNKTMEAQDEFIRLKTAERLQELMGVDVSDLTMSQLQELMDLVKEEALAQGEQKDKLSDKINEIFGTNKEKEKAIRDGIQRMFDTYSTIIKDMFETGIDPFSDPDNPTTVEFKESDKEIVEEFMAMDLSLLDKKEALRAADALNNFLTNKSTAGMAAMLGEYDGRKNSKEVNEKGIRAKPIKMYWVPILGRSFYEKFASIPLFFEKLFKGVTRGNYVREKMGINSLVNHKAEALTLANRIINNYVIEFTKKKPNNKKFQDIYNIIERGIIGDLAKTIVGDEKQVAEEFNRRKKLIEETIQILEKGGTKKETKEAKVIKEVYDKIAKDSKTIEEVKAKADQTNVAAVQFWVDQWAKLYDQFADVALNVYNRVLDKSVNYVPDRFGFLERAEKVTKDADGFESMFFANSNSEYFYKKEAGSLMKSQPPKSLFKDGKSDMYVNLSFDTNNANALLEALIDIKTARDIRQIQAFKNDPNFEEIVPNGNDAKVLKERISALIRNIRNKRIVTDKTFRQLTRNLDRFASFGAALALAGPTQAIKQTIPVAVNTLFNAGSLNLSVINNKDVNDFINNSGMAIANRGLDATTELETLNQKLEQAADTKAGDLVRAIENINKKFLKVFLSNFDVFIARASWITYYEKSLRKQGVKGKIDYSTHKINQQAADYAQTMVDRQQNISDKDLAGKMYESGNSWKQFIVKVFFPLATFRMNQTTRMMNDVTVITSKTSSLEDKKIALRSFAGYAAEMATFRAIGIGVSYGLLYSIAQFIRGEDEDEEEKQKKFNNLIKGAATSVVSDVFSPMPQADMPVKYLFSSVLDQIQSIGDIKEEDRLNIFTENKESLSTAYGMFGIGLDKFNKLWEDVELGVTGKFKDDYGREKTIREKDRELLTNPLYVAIHLTSDFGISPFGPETNNVMNNITRMIKKDAMTEKQLEEYKETGEYPTKKSKAAKEEERVKKSEAYGGYETLKEFEEKDPIKYDEYSAPGGKLYQYREDERKEKEEKNKDQPFRGLSEKKFKELYPEEWRKNYGPGTNYYKSQRTPEMLQKKAQEKRDEAKRERERKMKEAIRKREENIRKALSK